jgi:hypothetical protein
VLRGKPGRSGPGVRTMGWIQEEARFRGSSGSREGPESDISCFSKGWHHCEENLCAAHRCWFPGWSGLQHTDDNQGGRRRRHHANEPFRHRTQVTHTPLGLAKEQEASAPPALFCFPSEKPGRTRSRTNRSRPA